MTLGLCVASECISLTDNVVFMVRTLTAFRFGVQDTGMITILALLSIDEQIKATVTRSMIVQDTGMITLSSMQMFVQ